MELNSYGLTLDEEKLKQIPQSRRSVYIFEWLRFLDKVLIAAQKNDLKGSQEKIIKQLIGLIYDSPGPSARKLIAKNLSTIFSVGDTFSLFDTVNKCNDILKNKDSPCFLSTKLAAICCIGTMYEKLGRMMGRSYEETVQILIRSLRSAESQMRIEIMLTLEKVCAGMGNALTNIHKEIYKASKHCLIDRVMTVRCAAVRCILEMLNHSQFLYTTELENLATHCFRAFDGSNYEVRCAVAKLLGTLIAMTQNQKLDKLPHQTKGVKPISLDEALGILMTGFLRGGAGFLKGTGEIIKGNSGVNREVRIGVTHAYVVFVQILGSVWLEQNIKTFLNHILYSVANPKAAASHVDAVYSRKCINFILHSVFGKMLGEKAQFSACKEIAQIVVKEMNSIDFNPENAKDFNQETLFSQHLLVCALQEIGCLIVSLGTTAHGLTTDPSLNLIDTTVSVLIHPCQAARLAAAWCLRCICIAVPSQITPLIDRCITGIDEFRTSPEAISGYSGALAAVLGGVNCSPLGIPYNKGKIVFNTAEELLRSASQNSRLSLNRTQAGWLLIGAIMTLGVSVVRGLLPRMLLLWRNSFPRSTKELDSEKARGDAFTWQVTLEGRAGALAAMHSFIQHCPELVNDDITRRLLNPIESALVMLSNISSIIKSYGQQLKAPSAMVRLRLYETLFLLPPQSFEMSYTHLLRMLVGEFTLTENPANTTTSQLQQLCQANDSVILGTWLQETDHGTIEDQLQSNSAAGSGALEHDPCYLYRKVSQKKYIIPGSLPLGVAVIDMSVLLYGQIFPKVTSKHRLQMIDHFWECIKNAKSARQEAVQINIFSALLRGLKGFAETKTNVGLEDIKKPITNLVMSVIVSPNPILRCASAEAIGRLAQVVSDHKFTAELAQTSFDRLKSARDVASRTGHSLALGCLHKYVGGMGSSQHLNTSVSILLALAQDQTSPVVQVWSLHALALIADSGGPMFRGYVEPTLTLALKLLLNIQQSYIDVHQCIGKLLSALITTIGPELQRNTESICSARSSFLCACAIMQDHQDPLVQAEATACLQQLHLFVPKYVNLSSLVPTLCNTLSSNHLLLRKAAISCLRQLAQREAKEVCEHAMTLADESSTKNNVEGLTITETGLPGVLFTMLDIETDPDLIKDIHDTLTSMLYMLAADNLSQWLGLCKNVLTIATDSSKNADDNDNNEVGVEDDDQAQFHAEENTSTHPTVQPRWPTRVFAAECVRKIIAVCESKNKSAHFNLTQAKELQQTKGKGNFLVLHLSDLIRMSFIAATSDSDPLRLEGLKTLQDIIEKFAEVPEPEFPGHLLLEQFQAQVGAALRPAFSTDTSSHVTAAACQVCSTWIGSNVAKDLHDLRRVHHLLVQSLGKLQIKTNTTQLYNESLATLEKLAILKAWAEVYIVAMRGFSEKNLDLGTETTTDNDDDFGDYEHEGESLLNLVQPELSNLSQHWLGALRDHALLSLPAEFASQLPHDGGCFYTNDTIESSRSFYTNSWPPILHALALWLNSTGFENSVCNENILNNNPGNTIKNNDKFHLLFGICMEALCSPKSIDSIESIISCLHALHTLLDSNMAKELIMTDRSLSIELCNVLHRLILTRDSHSCQLLCMKVLQQVIKAAHINLESIKKNQNKTNELDNKEIVEFLGEGGEMGEILPGKSLVFAVLEVCLCLLVRQLPALSPSPNSTIVNSLRITQIHDESGKLIAAAISCMENLHKLCSPQGSVSILPTILYLTTGVIKELAVKNVNDTTTVANNFAIQAALHCLKMIASDRYCYQTRSSDDWHKLLQSALAKIIDLAKTGNDQIKLDEVTMILSVGVFVLHAPSEVITAPNLQFPCINHFRQCLQSSNPTVQLKCVQTLKSLFAHQDRSVAAAYIHSLAPRLMEILYSDNAKKISSNDEFSIILEAIVCIDLIISLVEPENRIQMLPLLVSVLISYLLENQEMKTANTFLMKLHDLSLQWLMKIGLKYPQEFKKIMTQYGDMKIKLEVAIRQQNINKTKNDVKIKTPTNNAPSIKLKTDFSNFS